MNFYPMNVMYRIMQNMEMKPADCKLSPEVFARMINKRLGPQEKTAVELFYSEGRNYRGVSRLMDIDEAKVKEILRDALMKLAKDWNKEISADETRYRDAYRESLKQISELKAENLRLRRRINGIFESHPEIAGEDILMKSISELNLPEKIENILRTNGILKISNILQAGRDGLKALDGVGNAMVGIIIARLDEKGLALPDKPNSAWVKKQKEQPVNLNVVIPDIKE